MDASVFDGEFVENQPMLAAQQLLGHGYEPVDAARGTFLKRTGELQGLCVELGAKRFPRQADDRNNLSVSFGIARRDVNEHLEQWNPDLVNGIVRKPWSPTVVGAQKSELFSRLDFSFADPADEVLHRLEWRLEAHREWTDLEHFEELLYGDGVRYFSVLWDRIINDALSGRDDRSQKELQELRDGAADATKEWRQSLEHFEVAYRDFRQMHPGGIR